MEVKEFEENGWLIREVTTKSGKTHIIKAPILVSNNPIEFETEREKLERIENTVDLLLLKQEGIL